MAKTKEELRKSQYDNPEVKKKWREANLRRYAEDPELRYSITKKAREARTKKAIQRFKTNPKIFISKRGYKMIYVPMKGTKKYHHFVWEKTHPPVQKGFVLHHINFNKLDNRMENLKLMNGREHNSLHAKISNEQNKEKFREYALARQRDSSGRFLKCK